MTSAVGFSSGDTVSARQRPEPGNRHGRRGQRQYAHARGNTEVGAWRRRADHPDRRQSPLPGSRAGAGRLRCRSRVERFGKNSEPALTAAGELFASGLSPEGTPHVGDEQPVLLRLPARCLDTGPRRHRVRSPVEQEGAIRSSPSRTHRTRTRSARSCSGRQLSSRSSRARGTTACVGSTTDCRPVHSRCPGRTPPGSSSRNRSSASYLGK